MSPTSPASKPIARSSASLHRRFIRGAGFGGAAIVLLLGIGANALLSREINQRGDGRIVDAAGRSAIIVTEALAERTRQVKVLALAPVVVHATEEGNARAKQLGIVGTNIDTLEKRFNGTRSMLVAPEARLFLISTLPALEAADMLLTDENGYNAVITNRSSDFVQSDEAWWQITWRDGVSPAAASYDSAAKQFTVEIAAVVKDAGTKVGVLKLKSSVAPLVRALASAGAGVRIDVIDSTDRIILSSDVANVNKRLRGMPIGEDEVLSASSVVVDSVSTRAAVARTNNTQWRVVAHLRADELAAPYRAARIGLVVGTVALLLVLIVLLAAMNQFLQRRISLPARQLAEAAEAVAAGDFTVRLQAAAADDEIGRLSRAIGAMIVELQRLARAIAESARESNVMTSEITAGSEEMASSASEIARTASDLSEQSTSMAETIGSLAQSAGSLRDLAAALDKGARDGVARNSALRSLALENRTGLDTSSASLDTLAGNVNASAAAIASLAEASEEIRSFVTLVRKLARQSKLLALNAAMEAARAGEHGQGFAVVASEVRRLATMSSDAAERTEAIVKNVLVGIDRSRDSADRAVSAANEVRVATARASTSFADIEQAVAQAEAWTASIEQASTATSGLVGEMTERLDSLAAGTETFAAAMEEVASSSEEQSASTEEIAGAANALGSAAERLSKLVGELKIE